MDGDCKNNLARSRIWWALLLTAGLVYHVVLLRTYSHWWFEDDPAVLAAVKTVANPLRFFFDRGLIQGFSAALVPMLPISMWIDSALAYRSVGFAHLHHFVSLEVTLILLFGVLRGFGLKSRHACALAILWLLLPATVVVNEFLSVRHYLEGFAWSLAAILVAQKISQGRWRVNAGTMAVLLLLLGAAALSKEIFAFTVPIFVFFYLYDAGRRAAAAVLLLVPALYLADRIWALGTSIYYQAPFVGAGEYLLFLSRFPYIFAGNIGGYVLAVLTAAVLVQLYRAGRIRPEMMAATGLILGSALAAIYPVTFPVNLTWMEHGTWYRAVFVISTGLLLSVGYLISKTAHPYFQRGALIASSIILLLGAIVTARKWQQDMSRYEFEGKYYLAHDDRLIYSELPARWYLAGLSNLYGGPRHFITFVEHGPLSPEQTATYQTIWRYRDGTFVEDRQLYETLRGK